ncbi:MAG: hypothetical protein HOC23_20505 [Halieaceae bacterium]|nr:hypothetical protein [Halieaceae bacterium]
MSLEVMGRSKVTTTPRQNTAIKINRKSGLLCTVAALSDSIIGSTILIIGSTILQDISPAIRAEEIFPIYFVSISQKEANSILARYESKIIAG